MRLRTLIAAALIQRLKHRREWRRAHSLLARVTVDQVTQRAALRGQAPSDAIQTWLIEKCAQDACLPRRPWLLRREELEDSSDSDDW